MTAVAIDGPAGAGKSTVARATAEALGFRYLDTGAMYRALTLAAIEKGIDITDGDRLAALANALRLETTGSQVSVDDVDVSDAIRRPEVTAKVPVVSAHPQVRRSLLDLQRLAARGEDVVMEGRDIGTKVLPDATVKVFLTASIDERTKRRGKELGVDDGDLESLRAEIADRDERDSTRPESPLARAGDAVVVDTTGRPVDEIVGEIVQLVREARS